MFFLIVCFSQVWYEDLSNEKHVPVKLSSSLADVLNGSSRY